MLGAALFFSGWHACFQEVEFSPEEIRVLEGAGAVAVPVALLQEESDPSKADTHAQPAAEGGEADASAPILIGPFAGSSKNTPSNESSIADAATGGSISRAAAERLALRLRTHGFGEWSEPTAWATAVVKLLGGALLVLGLLTRVWAFLAAVIFGATFWLGSVETAGMFEVDPFQWVAAGDGFQDMFSVLALFVLSFGLLVSGPGVLSLDRVFWPRVRSVHPETQLASPNTEAY